MNDDDFESLKRGLAQAEAYKAGERKGFATHTLLDIKAIRTAVGKSQVDFAAAFKLPVGTVRDWEQGRSVPDAPARSLLAIIAADPATAERLIHAAPG